VIEIIRQRLSDYEPRPAGGAFRAKAAILVPLYVLDEALHVVLTKRTDKVHSHKGEISFPGGAWDETDTDLQFTALRESHEEIGLQPRDVRVIGRIDDIITISSYYVSAYVGEIDPARSPYAWMPQELEVAEVIEVPLVHLLAPESLVEVPRNRNGELMLQPAFQYGEHEVWGATYRMLRNFLDVAVSPHGPASPRADGQTGRRAELDHTPTANSGV